MGLWLGEKYIKKKKIRFQSGYSGHGSTRRVNKVFRVFSNSSLIQTGPTTRLTRRTDRGLINMKYQIRCHEWVVYCDNYWGCDKRINCKYSFFFFNNSGCSGQLMRTTTNLRIHWTSCKPSEHVKHRGSDRRVQWELNPNTEKRNKSFPSLDYNLKYVSKI
jgi:hypothetical protein